MSVRPLPRFVLLNFVVLAALVGSPFSVPGDTSLLKYAEVGAILVAFLNYSQAVWTAIAGKSGSDDPRKGAAKTHRFAAMIVVSWADVRRAGPGFLSYYGRPCDYLRGDGRRAVFSAQFWRRYLLQKNASRKLALRISLRELLACSAARCTTACF